MREIDSAVQELENGNYIEGEKILLFILQNDPDNIEALYNLGMCYSEMGNYKESILILEKCVDLNPFITNAFVALGFSYYKKDLYEKAINVLLQALALEPDNFFALKNLGAVFKKTGDNKRAIFCLEQANAIAPGAQQVLFALMQAYEDSYMFLEAKHICLEIIESSADERVKNYASAALTRISQKEKNEL